MYMKHLVCSEVSAPLRRPKEAADRNFTFVRSKKETLILLILMHETNIIIFP